MFLHGQFLYLSDERECCAVTTRCERLPVYYCYSCSSPEQSPVARKILVFNKHARKTGAAARCFCRFKDTARRVSSVCPNFASPGGGAVRAAGSGRTVPLLSRRCFRCMNKGLDGVVGSAQSVGGGAGGLFTIITRSR